MPRISAKDFDAQWNDDGHNVLHVLLTGEDGGYYADYADQPARKLARCLAEGFVYQGEHSRYHGEPRGMPSAHLPPTAFVLFLQNHDQIGNRAFGERLTDAGRARGAGGGDRAAAAVPADPAAVHGRGDARAARRSCSLPTTARAGRCGARGAPQRVREVRGVRRSGQPRTHSRSERAADLRCIGAAWLTLRRAGARGALSAADRAAAARSCRGWMARVRLTAEAVGPKAVVARWRLGDGAVLTLASNLDAERGVDRSRRPGGCCSPATAPSLRDRLPADCTCAFLDEPRSADE